MDILLPHYMKWDYKIEFKENVKLLWIESLQWLLKDEFNVLKIYIKNNLEKRFIISSIIEYALLILFI